MIKNERQLVRARQLIAQVEAEIAEIENTTHPTESEFFAAPLRQDINKLRSEIQEYLQLRALPFQAAVSYIQNDPAPLEDIGSLLAKLRIAAKITQEQMAQTLGWHQSNISRFESENYSGQTIAKVSEYAGALGVWLHVSPSLTEAQRPILLSVSAMPTLFAPLALQAQATSSNPPEVHLWVASPGRIATTSLHTALQIPGGAATNAIQNAPVAVA